MNRAALTILLLWSLAAPAHASDTAEEIEQEIDGALTEGAYRDALELSEEAIQQHPERARTWFLRGTVLAEVGRAREAAAAFAQSVRRKPTAQATAAQAMATWMAGRDQATATWIGDRDQEADDIVTRALRRWPKDSDLRRVREALHIVDGCRHMAGDFAHETPQYVAERFMLDLKNREYLRVLTNHIDPPLSDRWLPQARKGDIRVAVEDFTTDVARSLGHQTLVPRLIGFVVSDQIEMNDPRARVGVNVLVEAHAEPELLQSLRQAGDSALSAFWLKGKWGDVMRDLTPEQRELTLSAMAEGYTLVAPIFVELVPRDGSWKVVDVVIPSLDSLRLASLLDAEAARRASPPPSPAAPAPARSALAKRPSPDDSDTPSGSRLLVMLGGGLAAAVIAFLVLRWLLARSRT
jgi:tetratricopeptide (TPR) repeat protein